MRTCFWNRQSKTHGKLRAFSSALLFALCTVACAQTLARPGWAGSGVAIEPWWRRAVFYRIDPANFQDSDGDGRGDLAGITQRLGYLQSLGVDAIVLRLPVSSATQESQSGLEGLARAAAEHKLRVMVQMTSQPTDNTSDETNLNAARFWLNQGVAGIILDSSSLPTNDDERAATFVHSLRTLLNGFPGGRILIADAAPVADPALAKALAQSAQLISAKPLAPALDASTLRSEMEAALGTEPAEPVPVHVSSSRRVRARPPEPSNFLWSASRVEKAAGTTSAQLLERTMATLLLASRAAVLVDYGEEIGLGANSLMQWTPKNITPPPAPIERREATIPVAPRPKPQPQSNVYGPYVPYVPPAKPKPPEADTPAKIDPDTLPGFTTGGLIEPPSADAATINVAVEDADPHSLLNFYRKLIQLHHGNASVRNGTETVLNHDDLNALAWMRRPLPGVATATTVVAVCNLSAKPLMLSLDIELKLHAGTFHTLAGDAKLIGSTVTVSPGSVWLGEWRR